jgi:hypothetical protein
MIPPLNVPPPKPPPKARVVFEYDPETQAASFRLEGNFPLPSLVNVLEVAALQFKIVQLQGTQGRPGAPGLCMPDGSPPPR